MVQVHQPKKCNLCGKNISSEWELKKHKVLVHKQTKGAYLCDMCPKKCFFTKETYLKHMSDKHSMVEMDSD